MGDLSVFIIVSLLTIVAFQQWFFLTQIQKLVDKLMSRSFHEYEAAKKPNVIKVPLPNQEIPDDLGILSEFRA